MRVTRSTLITIAAALSLLVAWPHTAATQQASKLIGVIGITREVAPVETRLEGATTTRIQGLVFTSGTIDGTAIVTARTGVGKADAVIAATLLVDHFAPSAVVFTGTAGAIDPDLNPGDVVIGTAVAFHDFGDVTAGGFVRKPTRNPISGRLDPTFFPADPALLAAAQRAARTVKLSRGPSRNEDRDPKLSEGVIVTGDAFIASSSHRAELRRELNASAVEMEGSAVALVCARFGVPVIVIRSITDRADGEAEDSYRRFVDTAARNAAELTLATIRQLPK